MRSFGDDRIFVRISASECARVNAIVRIIEVFEICNTPVREATKFVSGVDVPPIEEWFHIHFIGAMFVHVY